GAVDTTVRLSATAPSRTRTCRDMSVLRGTVSGGLVPRSSGDGLSRRACAVSRADRHAGAFPYLGGRSRRSQGATPLVPMLHGTLWHPQTARPASPSAATTTGMDPRHAESPGRPAAEQGPLPVAVQGMEQGGAGVLLLEALLGLGPVPGEGL